MIGLGRILAETREARGITLDEAERETRISRRYLTALEEEDFNAFPARAQARGFLRMYALYLELDAAEMLALFPADSSAEDADGLLHVERIFREPRQGASIRFPSLSLRQPATTYVLAVAGAVLLAALIAAVGVSGTERADAQLVLLAESGSLRSYIVPDVREESLAGALDRMEEAGLRPLVVEVTTDRIAAGLVISQSPPPGSSVLSPSDVTLIVSRGR
jgi:transcriptional regulator with XRE-family HTH domain